MPREQRWRTRLVTAMFLIYAAVLLVAARGASHFLFHGWKARLCGMAIMMLGLLPWVRWLAPRITRVLTLAGWVALVGCYFTFMAPFALLMWLTGDRRRWSHQRGAPRWTIRPPLPTTIAAAQLES